MIRAGLTRVRAASEFSPSPEEGGGGGGGVAGWGRGGFRGQSVLFLFPDASTQRFPANKIEVLIKGFKQLAHIH